MTMERPVPPPAKHLKSCYTCRSNERCNSGCDPCWSCMRDATMHDPKPRHTAK